MRKKIEHLHLNSQLLYIYPGRKLKVAVCLPILDTFFVPSFYVDTRKCLGNYKVVHDMRLTRSISSNAWEKEQFCAPDGLIKISIHVSHLNIQYASISEALMVISFFFRRHEKVFVLCFGTRV